MANIKLTRKQKLRENLVVKLMELGRESEAIEAAQATLPYYRQCLVEYLYKTGKNDLAEQAIKKLKVRMSENEKAEISLSGLFYDQLL